jgi:hypothetical protein
MVMSLPISMAACGPKGHEKLLGGLRLRLAPAAVATPALR